MTPKQKEQYNHMVATLRLISKGFATPAQLSRSCLKDFGVEFPEALTMAYENIQETAAQAVRGVSAVK